MLKPAYAVLTTKVEGEGKCKSLKCKDFEVVAIHHLE